MPRKKKVYTLNEGMYRSGASCVIAVVESKKEARATCLAMDYRWSSYDQSFLNEMERKWIRVDAHVLGQIPSGEPVSYGMTKEQREKGKAFLS
jgi:hypothetical protein